MWPVICQWVADVRYINSDWWRCSGRRQRRMRYIAQRLPSSIQPGHVIRHDLTVRSNPFFCVILLSFSRAQCALLWIRERVRCAHKQNVQFSSSMPWKLISEPTNSSCGFHIFCCRFCGVNDENIGAENTEVTPMPTFVWFMNSITSIFRRDKNKYQNFAAKL